MKILFVHQNFPAQFKHLAPALASSGHEVVAMHINECRPMAGIQLNRYQVTGAPSSSAHPWLADLNVKIIRAHAAWNAACELKRNGFEPDVIYAHPGWGESLFFKQVWPRARLGIFCEFYYRTQGADVGFDPEFGSPNENDVCRLQLKNANYDLHFMQATAGIAPTHWQASLFPQSFASRISVIHDGIQTDLVRPDMGVTVRIKTPSGNIQLSKSDEVITFVSRNLEPYRGYHCFMRALPAILKARPNARVLLVGGQDVSYGANAPTDVNGSKQSWKDLFFNEIKSQLDTTRIHFLGRVSYPDFIRVLQISTVHVYLTYPFVLGWSLLEAMSAGCSIVASDTPPVQEVIRHGENGQLVSFFDTKQLSDAVIALCRNHSLRAKLGENAREMVIDRYDLRARCLPAQMHWIQELMDFPPVQD